ncbi:hypothetical protein [Edaphobacter aggregans]|uniref:hypothetical protein n=1 Tax=Edaphobacter aggregans TaxID=570835 RepID=UPI001FE16119|nr:hypothetical protein [Edaphobacter aggregans]
MDRRFNPSPKEAHDSAQKPALLLAVVLLCITALAPSAAVAAPPDHWVGNWATSPVALPNPEGKYGASDTTYREIVHISLGGDSARVILTNEFGLDSLTVSSAFIALRTTGSEIDATTARPSPSADTPPHHPPGRAHRQRPGRPEAAPAVRRCGQHLRPHTAPPAGHPSQLCQPDQLHRSGQRRRSEVLRLAHRDHQLALPQRHRRPRRR